MELRSRRDYWNQAASEKRFQHQPRYDWLTAHVPGREILDFGCGYGRLLGDLATNGYLNVVGTDFSEGMLTNAAAHLGPGVRLVQTDGRTLPFRNRSFDAVLLFTVLTCMPEDGEQHELLAEVKRVLRPRGVVYISDLLLNSDARNVSRYQQFAEEFGTYGVFRLPEGVVVRHHSVEWIQALACEFDLVEYETFTVTTMNGNSSAAFQFVGSLVDLGTPLERQG